MNQISSSTINTINSPKSDQFNLLQQKLYKNQVTKLNLKSLLTDREHKSQIALEATKGMTTARSNDGNITGRNETDHDGYITGRSEVNDQAKFLSTNLNNLPQKSGRNTSKSGYSDNYKKLLKEEEVRVKEMLGYEMKLKQYREYQKQQDNQKRQQFLIKQDLQRKEEGQSLIKNSKILKQRFKEQQQKCLAFGLSFGSTSIIYLISALSTAEIDLNQQIILVALFIVLFLSMFIEFEKIYMIGKDLKSIAYFDIIYLNACLEQKPYLIEKKIMLIQRGILQAIGSLPFLFTIQQIILSYTNSECHITLGFLTVCFLFITYLIVYIFQSIMYFLDVWAFQDFKIQTPEEKQTENQKNLEQLEYQEFEVKNKGQEETCKEYCCFLCEGDFTIGDVICLTICKQLEFTNDPIEQHCYHRKCLIKIQDPENVYCPLCFEHNNKITSWMD